MSDTPKKEKAPVDKLNEFLEKENIVLEIQMDNTSEQTKSGKVLLTVTPIILVKKG